MFLEQLCGAPLLGGSVHRYSAGTDRTSSMKCGNRQLRIRLRGLLMTQRHEANPQEDVPH